MHRRTLGAAWADANGKMRIEAFSIKGMAHGVPLATAKEESCGSAGAFFLDVGISSTHHIARLWNLHESAVESPQAVTAPTIVQAPSKGRYLVVADAAAEAAHSSAEASRVHTEERRNRYSLNPNAVIAAAFRSAGLPAPEVPSAPNTRAHVAPVLS